MFKNEKYHFSFDNFRPMECNGFLMHFWVFFLLLSYCYIKSYYFTGKLPDFNHQFVDIYCTIVTTRPFSERNTSYFVNTTVEILLKSFAGSYSAYSSYCEQPGSLFHIKRILTRKTIKFTFRLATTETQCRHLFVTVRLQLDDATSNYRKVICPIPTPFVYEVISLRKWTSSYD